MKKYRVHISYDVFGEVIIEASSPESAALLVEDGKGGQHIKTTGYGDLMADSVEEVKE